MARARTFRNLRPFPQRGCKAFLTLTNDYERMGLDNAARAQLPAERRAVGRARTDWPARLQTPVKTWDGRLWDLSEAGARVQVYNPPQEGTLVLLSWQSAELFCRVIWSADDMCGVLFERPISRAVVLETLGEPVSEPDVVSGSAPAASVGKIPIGKRRSRLRSVDS